VGGGGSKGWDVGTTVESGRATELRRGAERGGAKPSDWAEGLRSEGPVADPSARKPGARRPEAGPPAAALGAPGLPTPTLHPREGWGRAKARSGRWRRCLPGAGGGAPAGEPGGVGPGGGEGRGCTVLCQVPQGMRSQTPCICGGHSPSERRGREACFDSYPAGGRR